MYKIAICEDDENYIEFLKKMIAATNIVNEEGMSFITFKSGEAFYMERDWDYDLVIMDMQLDKMDGYETAVKLREIDSNMLLVFCSGAIPPFSNSFKVNPFRYLLKNLPDDEMMCEITEIIKEMKARKNYPFIVCKSNKETKIRVYPESVLYFSIERNYCAVHLYGKLAKRYPDENLRVNMKLDEIYKIFNEECGFVRSHKSYIINMAYIASLDSKCVYFCNNAVLTYSRSRGKEFKQIFAEFVAAKYKE